MAELVLHVPDIDEAGKDYAFELAAAWLDPQLADATLRLDPEFGPGSLAVHAQQNGSEYLVTGRLRAHLLTECSRCLGDAKVPVDVELAALYTRGGAKSGAHDRASDSELDIDEDDDLSRETFTGNDIALDDLVREHLVLEVPMQPLCSEQCQGIAVPKHLRPPEDTFGAADAVDPRLAPLQRLRDNVPAASPSGTRAPAGGKTPAADAPRAGERGPRQPDTAKKPKKLSNKLPNKLPNKE